MASAKTGFERFGLTGNPFRDLSSDSLEDISLLHVNQTVDAELEGIRSEVIEKENRAVVMILAGLGAGKTERLVITRLDAEKSGVFCVMRNITPESQWVVKGIADSILEEAKRLKRTSFFPSGWQNHIRSISKQASKGYDPEEVGKAFAEALNRNAPSFLLLNDMHGLEGNEDIEPFLHALHALFDALEPGVMVALTSDDGYFAGIIEKHASLKARINRWITIPPLSDDEASLMIAKRLVVKRVVEEMQPLYPFNDESVRILNARAKGNPRDLIRLCDIVLDHAIKRKSVAISPEIVESALSVKMAAEA